jgi:hypothetical protein
MSLHIASILMIATDNFRVFLCAIAVSIIKLSAMPFQMSAKENAPQNEFTLLEIMYGV